MIKQIFKNEVKNHLVLDIIPFWEALRDDEYGGFYGYKDFNGNVDKNYDKGCILNSRITWFFSEAYLLLRDDVLLQNARHGYEFLMNRCLDKENGGVFWSVTYDGKPADTTKHTYNQGFAIYALSTYYEATGERKALDTAFDIYNIIESKCRDEGGYLEAFKIDFTPESNEKLSENGAMATRTMNTLLHVFEGYSRLYKVTNDERVAKSLKEILDIYSSKIFNPEKHRQEVFFDHDYHSLIDLISYGHDIESAWLIDEGTKILGDKRYIHMISPLMDELCTNIYETAFDGHSLPQECENGKVNEDRVWWVQAETINGFLHYYLKYPGHVEYLSAAQNVWDYIKKNMMDKNNGNEWYWLLDKDGHPYTDKPIVEPWKCPYHNGRMCIKVLKDL